MSQLTPGAYATVNKPINKSEEAGADTQSKNNIQNFIYLSVTALR